MALLFFGLQVKVLEEYRERHGWVLDALDAKSGSSEPGGCDKGPAVMARCSPTDFRPLQQEEK
eukprot:398150-Pelagomonas_calceolata.AAC.5